ncbi:hypothetical protein [Kitasatospora indigofera]|uniref:hypothetical protein n=1 Tax=Kitasatospora indigofera TaxID=67307 RepID=UPI00368AC1F9
MGIVPEEHLAGLRTSLQLMAAVGQATGGREVFGRTLRRLLLEADEGPDPDAALNQLILWLATLSEHFLDQLSDATGLDRGTLLAQVYRERFPHLRSPD